MIGTPRIPEVLHLYWDGSPMSYLQYLTVKSFLKHNQSWRIKLHIPSKRYERHTWQSFEQKDPYRGKNYFDRVLDLDVDIRSVDMEEMGFSNDIPEVVKSDYWRYRVLSDEGGYWCDFDVLFFKAINSIYDNKQPFTVLGNPQDVDTLLCPVIQNDNLKYYTIGFLASSPGNPFFADLAELCHTHLDLNNYQSIGVNMLKKVFPKTDDIKLKYQDDINLLVLPHHVYLPLEYFQTDIIFEDGAGHHFPNYTVGIHWFNGHPNAKKFQNAMGNPAESFSKKGKIFEYLKPYLKPVRMNDTYLTRGKKSPYHADVFTRIYESNLWRDNENKSGSVSTLSSTEKLREKLQQILSDFGISSIGDLACGDFNWMCHMDLTGVKYTGIDVVEAMISANNEKHANENTSFATADLISDPIDQYDLVVLRDVLVHLTMEDAYCILQNILDSGSRYLLTTSFTGDRDNIDLKYSGEKWRTVSLNKNPFNFPEPLWVINEGCAEGDGQYTDKSMLLFEISKLKGSLEKFEISPLWFSQS